MDEKSSNNRHDKDTRSVEILVRTIRPDSEYLYDIYDEYGSLVLEANTPMTDSLRNHLLSKNIEKLFYDPSRAVEAPESNDAGIDSEKSMIDDKVMKDALDHTKDFFEHLRSAYDYSKDLSISKGWVDKSRNVVDNILDSVSENSDGIFTSISDLKTHDEYIYQHSTNTSVLGAILSSKLDFKKDIQMAIGLGGLFHDIGKTSISKYILDKAKLNDEEFNLVKMHPHVGYKALEKNPNMTDLEKRILLLHHERSDGGGYPFGFEMDHYKDQVPREIRLFALCNVYSIMVQKKPGEVSLTPRDALRKMLNMVYARYKKVHYFLPGDFRDFVKALGFSVNKGNYFIGHGDLVRISTGEVAIIEEMNKLYPMNPKVLILKNHRMEAMKRPIQINMLMDFNIHISNVFDKTITEKSA